MDPIIVTYTGRQINPLDIQEKDIDIKDIAHALSLCNRFAGHTRRPISVAQHSVYVARLCSGRKCELQALLHDASEAYLGDMTKWLKAAPEMKAFRDVEAALERRIYHRFKCGPIMHHDVELADHLMVRFEAFMGFGSKFVFPPSHPSPTKEEIDMIGEWTFWSWELAEERFLQYFNLLMGI